MSQKKANNDRLRNYALIITTTLVLIGVGLKAYGHFAKTTTVEALSKTIVWVEERLAIGTHDDRVHRQQEAVDRSKNRIRFEGKRGNPTINELEDVELQERRLQEVIKERDELIEQYKSKK